MAYAAIFISSLKFFDTNYEDKDDDDKVAFLLEKIKTATTGNTDVESEKKAVSDFYTKALGLAEGIIKDAAAAKKNVGQEFEMANDEQLKTLSIEIEKMKKHQAQLLGVKEVINEEAPPKKSTNEEKGSLVQKMQEQLKEQKSGHFGTSTGPEKKPEGTDTANVEQKNVTKNKVTQENTQNIPKTTKIPPPPPPPPPDYKKKKVGAKEPKVVTIEPPKTTITEEPKISTEKKEVQAEKNVDPNVNVPQGPKVELPKVEEPKIEGPKVVTIEPPKTTLTEEQKQQALFAAADKLLDDAIKVYIRYDKLAQAYQKNPNILDADKKDMQSFIGERDSLTKKSFTLLKDQTNNQLTQQKIDDFQKDLNAHKAWSNLSDVQFNAQLNMVKNIGVQNKNPNIANVNANVNKGPEIGANQPPKQEPKVVEPTKTEPPKTISNEKFAEEIKNLKDIGNELAKSYKILFDHYSKLPQTPHNEKYKNAFKEVYDYVNTDVIPTINTLKNDKNGNDKMQETMQTIQPYIKHILEDADDMAIIEKANKAETEKANTPKPPLPDIHKNKAKDTKPPLPNINPVSKINAIKQGIRGKLSEYHDLRQKYNDNLYRRDAILNNFNKNKKYTGNEEKTLKTLEAEHTKLNSQMTKVKDEIKTLVKQKFNTSDPKVKESIKQDIEGTTKEIDNIRKQIDAIRTQYSNIRITAKENKQKDYTPEQQAELKRLIKDKIALEEKLQEKKQDLSASQSLMSTINSIEKETVKNDSPKKESPLDKIGNTMDHQKQTNTPNTNTQPKKFLNIDMDLVQYRAEVLKVKMDKDPNFNFDAYMKERIESNPRINTVDGKVSFELDKASNSYIGKIDGVTAVTLSEEKTKTKNKDGKDQESSTINMTVKPDVKGAINLAVEEGLKLAKANGNNNYDMSNVNAQNKDKALDMFVKATISGLRPELDAKSAALLKGDPKYEDACKLRDMMYNNDETGSKKTVAERQINDEIKKFNAKHGGGAKEEDNSLQVNINTKKNKPL